MPIGRKQVKYNKGPEEYTNLYLSPRNVKCKKLCTNSALPFVWVYTCMCMCVCVCERERRDMYAYKCVYHHRKNVNICKKMEGDGY